MTVYDLHCHSYHSDGVLTPEEVVKRAKACQVDVLALTDHDVVSGLAEARLAAAECGIRFIPGIEISVTWDKQLIHVVGLNIDFASAPLLSGLTQQAKTRLAHAERIAEQLEKAGIKGVKQGVWELVGHDNITRTHFARYLVQQGKAPNMRDCFERFLKHGRPGYVSAQWVSLGEAVQWIKQSGGLAVIAHPTRYKMTAAKLSRLIADFEECGGRGLEIIYGNCSAEVMDSNIAVLKRSQLLASIGSDFHDPGDRWIELGRFPPMPEGLPVVWQEFAV